MALVTMLGQNKPRQLENFLLSFRKGAAPKKKKLKSTEELQAWSIVAMAKSGGTISPEAQAKIDADLKAYSDMVNREVAKVRAKREREKQKHGN